MASISKKRILITGGAGFVGSHLVEHFLNQDNTVAVYDNFSFGRKENLPINNSKLEVINADIRQQSKLKSIFKEFRPQLVYHLAALHFIPYCNEHPQEVLEVNIQGTQHLIEAAQKYLPDLLFYASTAGVYKPSIKAHKETSTTGPLESYGISKYIGEKLFQLLGYQSNVPVVVGRFFNIFGPRETNPHVVPEIIKQISDGSTTLALGNLTPKRDYIYVLDVVSAIVNLTQNPQKFFDVYNIGTGTASSVGEIINCLEKILDKKLRINTDQSKLRKVDRPHLEADIRKLTEKISWKPKWDLYTGLQTVLSEKCK